MEPILEASRFVSNHEWETNTLSATNMSMSRPTSDNETKIPEVIVTVRTKA